MRLLGFGPAIWVLIAMISTTASKDCIAQGEESAAIRAPEAKLKAFSAALVAETNTWAPFYTSREDFEEWDQKLFEKAANDRGWELVSGKFLTAAPANKVLKQAYESMKKDLLADLVASMPVDMVVLELHGAMVALGYEDVEGDLLHSIREIVGDAVPIGAGLDAHAHLSQAMINAADILVFYKQWPHVDADETQIKAFNLTADVAEGKSKPHMDLYDPMMLADYHTFDEPLKTLVADMEAAENEENVVVVNFIHGFPYGDVADMGTKILVITDGQPELGATLARDFGRRLIAMRGQTAVPPLDFDQGLESTMASTNFPVVVADYSDMPFGGAPGDSTFILQGLLEKGIDNSIIAGLWDPMAISIVKDMSRGDRIKLRVGGKTGPMSGAPLDLDVEVRFVGTDLYLKENYSQPGKQDDGISVGTIAVVRARGIDIVLVEKRYPIYGYKVLEMLELSPRDSRIIVVKSGNNFYDGYAEIAGDVVYMMSPGLIRKPVDLVYTNIRHPKWPIDPLPPEDKDKPEH